MRLVMDLKIKWTTHKAAAFACSHWHHAQSLPVYPLVRIGIWENNRFIGVIIFSRGANRNMLKPYNIAINEGCELSRIALRQHKTPLLTILTMAIQLLRKNYKTLKIIIAYLDQNDRTFEKTYKNFNFLYVGKTQKKLQYFYHGKKIHSRSLSTSGFSWQHGKIKKTVRYCDCTKSVGESKNKYLLPLCRSMVKQIKPLSLPYLDQDII